MCLRSKELRDGLECSLVAACGINNTCCASEPPAVVGRHNNKMKDEHCVMHCPSLGVKRYHVLNRFEYNIENFRLPIASFGDPFLGRKHFIDVNRIYVNSG